MIGAKYQLHDFFIFFKKKLLRIEPPYLIVLCFTILLGLIRNIFVDSSAETPMNLFQILYHIGYLIPFSEYPWLSIVFWTLAIEFQFYLIISLIFTFLKFKIMFINAFYLFSMILSFISASDSHVFFWLPLFLTGINLALYLSLTYSKKWFIFFFIILNLFICSNLNILFFYFLYCPNFAFYFFLIIKSGPSIF